MNSMTRETGRLTYKIYVGNLSPLTTTDDLYELFKKHGNVVEAIVLHGKGFGFVHMANEHEGSYAMKSLHKYNLNGKEILLQQATNPKKASVVNNSHKASIGKGVSNLDDFSESSEYDTQYLEHEISQLLDNVSPSELQQHSDLSRNSSATSIRSLHQYPSSGANGLDQLNSLQAAFNGNGFMQQSLGVGSQQTLGVGSQQSLGIVSQQSLGVGSQQSIGVGSHQQLGVNSHQQLGVNALLGLNTHQQLGVSSNQPLGINSNNINLVNNLNGNNIGRSDNSTWCVPVTNNTPAVIGQLPLGNQTLQSNSIFSVPPSNNRILASLNSDLMNRNNGGPFTSNGHMNLPTTSKPDTSFLNRFNQYAANQSMNNVNGAQRLNSNFKTDSLQQSSTLNQDSFLEQHARDRQVQFLQTQVDRELEQEKLLAKSSMVDSLRNFSSPITSTSMASGLSRGNLSLLTSTLDSTLTNGRTESNAYCNMCKLNYDNQKRIPKILSCTHTFCLNCLRALALGSDRVKCPICEVVTMLNENDVTRLTTNQCLISATAADSNDIDTKTYSLINSLSQLGKNNYNQSPDALKPEVCATCSGSSTDQHVLKCRKDGHTLVPTVEAVDIIVRQLQPYITEEVSMLQQTMIHRNAKKERYESALRAVQKFTTELNIKIAKETKTQAMYNLMLENLKSVYDSLMYNSYNDLVKIYHVVKECKSNIDVSLSNAHTDSLVDEAVKAVIVQVHQKTLNKVNKLGILQNEVFVMDNGGILDNARDGNYANALLQYMVNDLLKSRIDHNKTLHKQTMNTTEKCLAGINDDSSSVENLTSSGTSSVSPDINSEITNGASSVFRSLTTSTSATPDINHTERNDVDNNLDITYLLQTTEAIEAEHSKQKNIDNYVGSALGLSNICNRVMNSELNDKNTPMEMSFMDDSTLNNTSSATATSNSQTLNLNMERMRVTEELPVSSAKSNYRAVSSEENSNRSSEIKPFSYLDAAKKPAKPDPTPKQEIVKMPVTIKQTKNPHAWLKVTVDGEPIGRIVFQLRPDRAPRMCENFLGLCTGKPGYGYKGTHFFKNGEGFLAGGDVEYDDGRGGYSIFDKDKFEADLCPLKDEVGMIRFKGNGTSERGKGMVGSQFMVWYAEREFKKFSYSLVFGRVVDGMDVVKKAANVDLGIHDVMIEDCGGGF